MALRREEEKKEGEKTPTTRRGTRAPRFEKPQQDQKRRKTPKPRKIEKSIEQGRTP
ncbi:unnamed protein product [Nippostrongylus brasiliensis]|uniref:High mobility group protein HMG-I/HMG-Y n=1 Tax=Nippostrongylus brasiliensis TaxID=27835 RepID=A0A0N4XNW8_NIPBR|nr:unnamed protein product [Nippostrongylus brasiliensis]